MYDAKSLKGEIKMKVAVIGSRDLTVGNLGWYLPEGTTDIDRLIRYILNSPFYIYIAI